MNALDLTCGAELERFDMGRVVKNNQEYVVLTGFEILPHRCFWCGGELKGKLRRYCYGHMKEYYRNFEWESASSWAQDRAGHRCENCGIDSKVGNLEVHHIVPLKGTRRYFSAYNLPFNLIVLCHACHLAIHSAMRPPKPDPIGGPLFSKMGVI